VSELLQIQHQLQDTTAAIAQLEKALAEHPESPVLRLNLASVSNRFRQLQEEFNRVADRNALDVCSYRLFRNDDATPSLRGFTGALHEFQGAFSSLYDALKNGRRLRARLGPDVIEATTFGFGYAYAGSVGVVMTLPKERMLIQESLLDDTIAAFFILARAPRHEDIQEMGKRLGPAPLRAIHDWASAHVQDGLGADIVWKQGEEVRQHVVLQSAELKRLKDEIAATSEEDREPVKAYAGTMLGASVETKRFDFLPDGAKEPISGRFTDAIGAGHAVKVPDGRYLAYLEKVTKIQYSTEVETTTWTLVRLEELL
jgi:hypothetical protein